MAVAMRSSPSDTTVSGNAVRRAQRREAGEMRIDRRLPRERVERLRRRPDEIDLARQAFARADAACHPVGLDGLPGWIGKACEQEIGRVTDRNRAVEIDENPDACVVTFPCFFPLHRLLRPHAFLSLFAAV